MMEQWKVIPNTDNQYHMSNLGKVRNSHMEELKLCKYGYRYQTQLSINNKRKSITIGDIQFQLFGQNVKITKGNNISNLPNEIWYATDNPTILVSDQNRIKSYKVCCVYGKLIYGSVCIENAEYIGILNSDKIEYILVSDLLNQVKI